MIEFPSAPAFLFAYVPRKPASAAELSAVPALRRQQLLFAKFTKLSGVVVSKRFVAVTTYRRRLFLDTPEFVASVLKARAENTPLLVADIRDLIMRTHLDLASACLRRLDELDVDLFDVATQRCWGDFDIATRRGIVSAVAVHRDTGKAISIGKKLSEPARLNIKPNQLAGAKANRKKADRQAEQCRTIVEELEAGLPPGELLSPSVLMHRLNELGIRPPRSERWSLNGAKRLLARIRNRADEKSLD